MNSKTRREMHDTLLRVADHIERGLAGEQHSILLRGTSTLLAVARMGCYRAKLAEIAARCEAGTATAEDAAYLRKTTAEYWEKSE